MTLEAATPSCVPPMMALVAHHLDHRENPRDGKRLSVAFHYTEASRL